MPRVRPRIQRCPRVRVVRSRRARWPTMTGTTVCPVCGDAYEPDYENRDDAPPRSIGREQHQTGICSDECWDAFLGVEVGA
jgi:uncharacterized Zn finger protein (UPF0148 family)